MKWTSVPSVVWALRFVVVSEVAAPGGAASTWPESSRGSFDVNHAITRSERRPSVVRDDPSRVPTASKVFAVVSGKRPAAAHSGIGSHRSTYRGGRPPVCEQPRPSPCDGRCDVPFEIDAGRCADRTASPCSMNFR
jgi:hypothetical protein